MRADVDGNWSKKVGALFLWYYICYHVCEKNGVEDILFLL